MPHFKCVACKTRMYSAATPQDPVAYPCPQCGSPLEPVDELAEIVGFRATELRAGATRVDDDGSLAEAVALPEPETEG
jgi:hypothetical protein